MRKQDFIKELRLNLSFLPKEEIEEYIPKNMLPAESEA